MIATPEAKHNAIANMRGEMPGNKLLAMNNEGKLKEPAATVQNEQGAAEKSFDCEVVSNTHTQLPGEAASSESICKSIMRTLENPLEKSMAVATDNEDFSLFPKLPAELRAEIWRWAANFRRVVTVDYSPRSQYLVLTYHFRVKPPAILHTNKESREAGLKFYRLLVHAYDSFHKPTYLNWDTDYLLFMDENILREFLNTFKYANELVNIIIGPRYRMITYCMSELIKRVSVSSGYVQLNALKNIILPKEDIYNIHLLEGKVDNEDSAEKALTDIWISRKKWNGGHAIEPNDAQALKVPTFTFWS